MLIARKTICYTQDIQVAVNCSCVTTTRCLRETLHCPENRWFNLGFLCSLTRIKQLVENFARKIAKILTN